MDRRCIIFFIAILFLGINIFFVPRSNEIVGLIPEGVQRDLIDINEVDGIMIMDFEELPKTFTLRQPIDDHSWFWSVWCYYRYTKIAEPEIIEENYDFGWNLENESFWKEADTLTLSEISHELGKATNLNQGDVKFTNLNEHITSKHLTMKGTLYRTRYQVEKVNVRLGIVTKRFNADVLSSNGLYISVKE